MAILPYRLPYLVINMINKEKLKQIEADNIEDSICIKTDNGYDCGQKPLTATQLLSCIDEPAKQEDGAEMIKHYEDLVARLEPYTLELESKVRRMTEALEIVADSKSPEGDGTYLVIEGEQVHIADIAKAALTEEGE